MRSGLISRFVLAAALWICLCGNAFGQTPQIGQNLASLIYLDGRNVVENAEFNLQRDQLLCLETYDLLPNSTVELSAVQKGVPHAKKIYQTNEKGAMKDVLFFPKAHVSIRCTVKFQAINGEEKRIVFHLKPI